VKVILSIFIIFLLIGCEKEKVIAVKETPKIQKKPLHVEIKEIEDELKVMDTNPYLENFIVNVINEGSYSELGFPSTYMEGGYAHKSDALNIARYVLTLSGRKSSDDESAKKSQIFYSSNCAGCHGDDGKGLNGAFPSLILSSFMGIKKRKECLHVKLKTLKAKL